MDHPPSTSPPPPKTERLVGLDGLRGISILLVLFGHGAATVPPEYRPDALVPYLGNAPLGVTIFFVISGFLITYLLRKEWEKTGTIRLGAFYTRRVLRIFPAFYTFLLTVVALRAAGVIHTTYADIATAAAFLTNYKRLFPSIPSNDHGWFVGHCWTLSLEEQFYLLWPATLLVCGLRRGPRVALLIVLVVPVIRVATFFAWPRAQGLLGTMLHTAADPLMIGCLGALLQGRPLLNAVLDRLSWWGCPLLAALFLLVASPWLAEHWKYFYYYSITAGPPLNGLAIVFIILWVVRHPTSQLTRVLSVPLLCYIGVLSYSLYLWQQLFLTTRNPSWLATFPVNFVACFVAAGLSYWVIERPFLRLRDRFRAVRPVSSGDGGADGEPTKPGGA